MPVERRYRLGPLRDVRQLDERAKRNDLAAAVGDARATADDVAAAARRVDAARAALAAALTGTTSGLAYLWTLADRLVARRRAHLDDAVAEHARAAAAHAGRLSAIDVAQTKLTAARANKEVIERHFARWRDAQKKLADRRED